LRKEHGIAPGSPFPAGAAPWALTVDDINSDRNPDVIVIAYHRSVRDSKQIGVIVLLGDGSGGFSLNLSQLGRSEMKFVQVGRCRMVSWGAAV
jgi:hypothetical protein